MDKLSMFDVCLIPLEFFVRLNGIHESKIMTYEPLKALFLVFLSFINLSNTKSHTNTEAMLFVLAQKTKFILCHLHWLLMESKFSMEFRVVHKCFQY